MTAAEMRGQDMQDAPEQIWIAGGHYWPDPTFNNDKRSYTRTDLCITEAECQRRIDAAVAELVKALHEIEDYLLAFADMETVSDMAG